MDSESLIKKLAELNMPVFTTKDVSIISGKSPAYTKVFLAGLVKRRAIEKVERGRYCLKGTSAYAIASRITKMSYVALISAARFHRITDQIPNTILVFSTEYSPSLPKASMASSISERPFKSPQSKSRSSENLPEP